MEEYINSWDGFRDGWSSLCVRYETSHPQAAVCADVHDTMRRGSCFALYTGFALSQLSCPFGRASV